MALIQLPYGDENWFDFDRKIGVILDYCGGHSVSLIGFTNDSFAIEIFDADSRNEAIQMRDELARFINRTLCTQNNPINAEDTLYKLLDDAHAAALTHHKDHPIHTALSEVKILIAHGSITDVSAWQLDTLRRHVLAHQQNKAGRD